MTGYSGDGAAAGRASGPDGGGRDAAPGLQPGGDAPPGTGKPDRMLRLGSAGALFAALCCFTPLLVVVLAGAGLSAVTGWLDYALFPMFFVCLAVIAQALWLRTGRHGPSPRLWAGLAAVGLSALIIWLEFRFAARIAGGALLALALYGALLYRAGARNPRVDRP